MNYYVPFDRSDYIEWEDEISKDSHIRAAKRFMRC